MNEEIFSYQVQEADKPVVPTESLISEASEVPDYEPFEPVSQPLESFVPRTSGAPRGRPRRRRRGRPRWRTARAGRSDHLSTISVASYEPPEPFFPEVESPADVTKSLYKVENYSAAENEELINTEFGQQTNEDLVDIRRQVLAEEVFEFTEDVDMVGKAEGSGEKKKVLEAMSLQFNSSNVPQPVRDEGSSYVARKGRRGHRGGRWNKRKKEPELVASEIPQYNIPKPIISHVNPITQALKRVRKDKILARLRQQALEQKSGSEKDSTDEAISVIDLEPNEAETAAMTSRLRNKSAPLKDETSLDQNYIPPVEEPVAEPSSKGKKGSRKGRGRRRGHVDSPHSESSNESSTAGKSRERNQNSSYDDFSRGETTTRGRSKARDEVASKEMVSLRSRYSGNKVNSNTPVSSDVEETESRKADQAEEVPAMSIPKARKKKKHFKGLRYSFVKKKKKPKVKNHAQRVTGSQETESLASEDVDVDSFDSSSQDTNRRLLLLPGEVDPYDPSAEFDDSHSEKSIPVSLNEQRKAFLHKGKTIGSREEDEEEYSYNQEDRTQNDDEVSYSQEHYEEGEGQENVEGDWSQYTQEEEYGENGAVPEEGNAEEGIAFETVDVEDENYEGEEEYSYNEDEVEIEQGDEEAYEVEDGTQDDYDEDDGNEEQQTYVDQDYDDDQEVYEVEHYSEGQDEEYEEPIQEEHEPEYEEEGGVQEQDSDMENEQEEEERYDEDQEENYVDDDDDDVEDIAQELQGTDEQEYEEQEDKSNAYEVDQGVPAEQLEMVDTNYDGMGGTEGGSSTDKPLLSKVGLKRQLEEDGSESVRKSKRLHHIGAASHPLAIAAPVEEKEIRDDSKECTSGLINVLCKCRIKDNPKAVNIIGEIYCQAVDSFDGRMIGCCNIVSNDKYLRVSGKIPFMLLCSIHRHRLRRHSCCPGCGLFCTQGIFLECRSDKLGSRHYYHKLCGLIINQVSLCPHCGTDQLPLEIHLELKLSRKPIIYLKQHQESKGLASSARMSVTKSLLCGVEEAPPNLMDQDAPILEIDGKLITATKLTSSMDIGMLNAAIEAIKRGKNINIKPSPKGIYKACKQGDLEKLLFVLAQGISPNARVKEYGNQMGLHTASTHGCLAAVHILVSAGSNLDLLDSQLQTPLMLALSKNHNDIVHYLVHAGASLTNKSPEGMTPLHLAAKCGNYIACRHILDSGRLSRHSIDLQDEGGWTPLVWASENRCINVVKILLDRGANPQICDVEQNTALHWAAFSGSTHICSMVIDRGCSLRSMNAIGDTPLHIAARQNHVDAVMLLLARGSTLEVKNAQGQSPLDCAYPESEVFYQLRLNKQLRSVTASSLLNGEKILSSDIAAGKEAVPIPCVNGFDSDGLPKDYVYIADNCEALNVNIDRTITSLKWCECEDGCNSDNCICGQLNFHCWYDVDGRLINDFNYADPPMIFECNRACSCTRLGCHNRVVQHGMTSHLQIYKTDGRGWGVRVLKDIQKGSYVCEYVGEIITDLEADQREDDSYLFDLDNRDSETFCMDARQFGNVARFINHLCQPNLTPVKLFIDHQDLIFPRIAFFANRDIEADEELGFDYGEKFWIIKYKHFTCKCGSTKCKYSSETIHSTLENYNRKIQEANKVNEKVKTSDPTV